MSEKKRIIVGISGASGAIYGIRTLEVLRNVADVETHLIWGEEDRIHPPQRCGAAMKKAMGAKSFTVLAGVGHSPPEEAPEAFLQALTEVTQCNYLEST